MGLIDIIKPLSQRHQDQRITRAVVLHLSLNFLIKRFSVIWQNRGLHDELVGLADGRGYAANGAPRVHDSLATSDRAAGLQRAVLEAPHHLETKLGPLRTKATQ